MPFAKSTALAACLILAAAQAPVLAAGIPGVVAPGEKLELVSEAFADTQGPLGTPDGGLYFSDIILHKTYYLDQQGFITIERERAERSSGIAFTPEGDLVFAEGGIPGITRKTRRGYVNLTEGYRLFRPNDLIVDMKGGIYFTDPGPRPVVPGLKVFVYYLPRGTKEPVTIDDDIPRPNGLALALDGKTLFVDDTLGTTVFAYDVRPDGMVANKRTFAELKGIALGEESLANGMAIDSDGRLYVATVRGVQVFNASGAHLGTIAVPRPPSNIAFSGRDKRVLFITARQGLYRLNMLSQGPERLGK
jgi:sugar lactone lactonase YvrE